MKFLILKVHLNKRFQTDEQSEVSGGAAVAGGVSGGAVGGGYTSTYSGTVHKQGTLFDDIFNVSCLRHTIPMKRHIHHSIFLLIADPHFGTHSSQQTPEQQGSLK